MSERIINITFAVKENILLFLKENKEDFTKEILFFSALTLCVKESCLWAKQQNLQDTIR